MIGVGMEQEVDSMDLVIAVYKKDVDVGMLRENLKRTPEERIRLLQDFLEFRERMQQGKSRRGETEGL